MASAAQLHAQMRVLREQRDTARTQAEQLREQRACTSTAVRIDCSTL